MCIKFNTLPHTEEEKNVEKTESGTNVDISPKKKKRKEGEKSLKKLLFNYGLFAVFILLFDQKKNRNIQSRDVSATKSKAMHNQYKSDKKNTYMNEWEKISKYIYNEIEQQQEQTNTLSHIRMHMKKIQINMEKTAHTHTKCKVTILFVLSTHSTHNQPIHKIYNINMATNKIGCLLWFSNGNGMAVVSFRGMPSTMFTRCCCCCCSQ